MVGDTIRVDSTLAEVLDTLVLTNAQRMIVGLLFQQQIEQVIEASAERDAAVMERDEVLARRTRSLEDYERAKEVLRSVQDIIVRLDDIDSRAFAPVDQLALSIEGVRKCRVLLWDFFIGGDNGNSLGRTNV